MTIGELLNKLEDFDEDTPVKLALQPNYPVLASIANVCTWENNDKSISKTGEICLIACSDIKGYGCPRGAWDSSYIESDED